nr:hypothetical protein [Tanacetum cinerariifolium]
MLDKMLILRPNTRTCLTLFLCHLFKKVSDQKDNTQDTSKNTKFAKQPIVENLSKIGETNALSKPVTSNSVSTPQESEAVNTDKLFKKVSDQKDNTQDTSKNTKFAKQPIVENLPKIGKLTASSNSESQYDCSNGDNACTSNDMEPKIKRFPNSTSLLDRLFRFVYGASIQNSSKNTKFAKQPIAEILSKIGETNALSKPVTSNSVSKPQEPKGVNNDKMIAPGMFRISPDKVPRKAKKVPNTVSASARAKPITVSQPSVITKKDKNFDLNGLSSTGVDNTKTRRPQPRSNTKNDRGRYNYVEGFGHNLFSVGQFCDSDLEVAFRRDACFVRNLEGVDLLKGDSSTNLYTINLHEMASAPPICLMARLPKFKYHKEHLCPSCEQGKSKRASHPPKPVPNSRQRLHLLHMDLCGPIRIASINGKRYVLVIVDDYSRYTSNDREDIGKLGVKGDIGFFIGYSADSYAYRVYNRRTKKIMETMNVSFNELSIMAFEQRSSKPRLQSMTSGQITMYDDYIGGQPSATARTVQPVQEPQVRQTSTASTTIADTAPIPTNSSSLATNIPITSQDVHELNPNAMVDGNTFVNPFANSFTSDAASSSHQNVDPSNMH